MRSFYLGQEFFDLLLWVEPFESIFGSTFLSNMASASLHTNLTNPHSKASSRGKRKADEEAAKELFELDVIGHRLVRDGPDSPLRDEFQVRRPAYY